MKKIYRKIHKYIGLALFIFIIIISISAIGLNHPELLISKNNNNTGFNISDSYVLKVNPFDSKNIFASNKKGLFESKDTGITWGEVKLFIPSDNINDIAFSPNIKDFLIVSIENIGLFRTDDRGDIWEEIELPFSVIEGEYIKSINISNSSILVKTDFALYNYGLDNDKWIINKFDNIDKNNSLKFKQLIYELHTGEFFGKYGRNFYDIIAISFILLSITGLLINKFKLKSFSNNIKK